MITRCTGTGLVCGLTFDDGPNGSATERLLDFLSERGIRATFCVIGESILAPGGAELLRRIVSDGHLLANHTTSWADLGDWPVEAIAADLDRNLGTIRQAIGNSALRVPFFRAPNGNWGESELVAASLGMQSLAVTNTIDDWNTQDIESLVSNLRAAIRPGELVLAHDGGGNRDATVDAVIRVVSERLVDGWTFTLPATTA